MVVCFLLLFLKHENRCLMYIKELHSHMHVRLKRGRNGTKRIGNSEEVCRFLVLGSRRDWDLVVLAHDR